jgi:maleylacetoacetate isomerase
VPTLVADFALDNHSSEAAKSLTITHSPAIFSFLENSFPSPPLVPPLTSPRARYRALEIASLVACDVQLPQNSRIRAKLEREYGRAGNGVEWARWVYRRGLGVVEQLLGQGEEGSRYCVGEGVSVADVFLVPAVQGALRGWG